METTDSEEVKNISREVHRLTESVIKYTVKTDQLMSTFERHLTNIKELNAKVDNLLVIVAKQDIINQMLIAKYDDEKIKREELEKKADATNAKVNYWAGGLAAFIFIAQFIPKFFGF